MNTIPKTNNQELAQKLHKYALQISNPFCYTCYQKVEGTHCSKCSSDDLMREVDGVGCEYGLDWVVKYILENEIEELDTEEAFEQYMTDVYCDPVIVCGIEMDQFTILKEFHSGDYRYMLSDFESNMFDNEYEYFTIDNGSTFYSTYEIEKFLDLNLKS